MPGKTRGARPHDIDVMAARRRRLTGPGRGILNVYPRRRHADEDPEAGSTVDLAIQDGGLIIRPVRGPRYSLEDLLEGVNAGNLHDEITTDEPVGREAW